MLYKTREFWLNEIIGLIAVGNVGTVKNISFLKLFELYNLGLNIPTHRVGFVMPHKYLELSLHLQHFCIFLLF